MRVRSYYPDALFAQFYTARTRRFTRPLSLLVLIFGPCRTILFGRTIHCSLACINFDGINSAEMALNCCFEHSDVSVCESGVRVFDMLSSIQFAKRTRNGSLWFSSRPKLLITRTHRRCFWQLQPHKMLAQRLMAGARASITRDKGTGPHNQYPNLPFNQ